MAAAGYGWRPQPLPPMVTFPDEVSPVYPKRAIRPLPKRRLRDRLSQEQSQSIEYPRSPSANSPLFRFAYPPGESSSEDRQKLENGISLEKKLENQHHACSACTHDHTEDVGIEMNMSSRVSQASPGTAPYSSGGPGIFASLRSSGAVESLAGESADSSGDGYESFENTSNKKKRKIPQANGIGGHFVSDAHSSGLVGKDPTASPLGAAAAARRQHDPLAHQSLPAVTAPGLPGNAKGRLNRSRRSSLTQISKSSDAVGGAKGLTGDSPPPKTDFTFTCESDSPKFVWPGRQTGSTADSVSTYPGYRVNDSSVFPARAGPPPSSSWVSGSAGNQVSSNITSQRQSHAQQSAGHGNERPPVSETPKKTNSRRPGRIYEAAARQRRLQQEYENFHNPKGADQWICEFCEYQVIFGKPPVALIRQYEIKDRKEQKRLAEKRRLLEKAKMKGRKGKKGTKNAGAGKGANKQKQRADHPNQELDQDQDQDQDQVYSVDGEDEEFEEEYDHEDEVASDGARDSAAQQVQSFAEDIPGPRSKTSNAGPDLVSPAGPNHVHRERPGGILSP